MPSRMPGSHRRGGEARGPRPATPRASARDRGEIARLLVDGRNVQRALERGSAPGSLPTAALVARLRAAFAPPTEVELILDGHAGGSPHGRVAPGLAVTYGRGRSADEVIAERAVEVLRELGPVGAWTVVVVSDDREVRDGVRRSGVRVEGTAWLADRLSGGSTGGPLPGAPRSGGPGGQPAASNRPARGSTIGNRPRR